MLHDQTEYKKKVRRWLKEVMHQNRQWLATKCGVNKRTVDNWLSSYRPIPIRAKSLIDSYMEDQIEREELLENLCQGNIILRQEEVSVRHVLSLTFSTEELLKINSLANADNESILTWLKGVVLERIDLPEDRE